MQDENSPEIESVDLVLRVQAGDARAREELFERFYPRVLGVVRARLGAGLRETLESGDIAHDAMIQAIGAFDRFEIRDRDALIRWFARIVENRILAAAKFQNANRRDRRREVRLPGPGAQSDGLGLAASTPSPASELVRGEQVQQLRVALEQLDSRSQELVRLRDGERMSWKDVAAELDLPSGDAARMLYTRILVRIKSVMDRREPGQGVDP